MTVILSRSLITSDAEVALALSVPPPAATTAATAREPTGTATTGAAAESLQRAGEDVNFRSVRPFVPNAEVRGDQSAGARPVRLAMKSAFDGGVSLANRQRLAQKAAELVLQYKTRTPRRRLDLQLNPSLLPPGAGALPIGYLPTGDLPTGH